MNQTYYYLIVVLFGRRNEQ